MKMPWSSVVASRELAKGGRMGIFPLPHLTGISPNRRRQASILSSVEEGGKLMRQLQFLEEHYSSPYNGSREGSSVQPSTWIKMQQLISQLLGWRIKEEGGDLRDLCVEHLLNAPMIKSWLPPFLPLSLPSLLHMHTGVCTDQALLSLVHLQGEEEQPQLGGSLLGHGGQASAGLLVEAGSSGGGLAS